MKGLKVLGIVMLTVMVGMTMFPFNANAAPPSPSPTQVTVINTPLPVTGNVGISGTPNVNVANTPLPVTVTNGGSNQPIREIVEIRAYPVNTVNNVVEVTFPQQIVIEMVAATCNIALGSINISTDFSNTATVTQVYGSWFLPTAQNFTFFGAGGQVGPLLVSIPLPPSKKVTISLNPTTTSSSGVCGLTLAYRIIQQ